MHYQFSNSHGHFRIKQTWESASGHFAMQMLQWEKSVCVNVTVTHEYTTPQRQCVLSEAYFKHNPKLFERAVVMSAYLLVFFTLSDLYPTGPEENDSTRKKQHIYILMCIALSI